MSREFTGKSVELAIEEGLRQLGLDESQVTIEVLSKGSRGILGIGSEAARVRITVAEPVSKPDSDPVAEVPVVEASAIETPAVDAPAVNAPVTEAAKESNPIESLLTSAVEMVEDVVEEITEEVQEFFGSDDDSDDDDSDDDDSDDDDQDDNDQDEAGDEGDDEGDDDIELEALAKDLLSEMLSLMQLQAQVVTSWETSEDEHATLVLDIQGRDLGMLIGRHGTTLASIQYLLRLMINQRLKKWPSIVVDVEQYKANRKARLNQMAQRLAEQVMDSGQAIAMEPMPAADRRLIHLALRDHPSVYTRSTGDDERRKVQILPKE